MAEKNTIYIKSQAEFDAAVKDNQNVLVDFYADWCPPCKKLGEVIKPLMKEDQKWKLLKLNIDDEGNQPIAEAHGVQGIPQVDLYIGGKQTKKFVGFNQAKLNEFISEASQ